MTKKDKAPALAPTPTASNTSVATNPEEAAEKDLIEEYLVQHGLESVLNVLLNQVVRDRPSDPYLVLGKLLQNRATSNKGIFAVSAKEIVDSSGYPTLLASVHTGRGRFDASTSSAAPAIFDTDDSSRYRGKGLRSRDVALYMQHLLEGMDPCDQTDCDEKIASMVDKIGRQACIALSMAVCKAGAAQKDQPLYEYIASLADVPIESACLPVPIFSLINGGTLASNKLCVQDISIIPIGCNSFQDALRYAGEVLLTLKDLLEAKGNGHANRGASGGLTPQLMSVEECLTTATEAVTKIKDALKLPAQQITLGLGVDIAAHAFATPDEAGDSCTYNIDKWMPIPKSVPKSSDELSELIREWVKTYNITTIVDPFEGRDIKVCSALNRTVNAVAEGDVAETGIGGDPQCKLQVVGHKLLQRGVETIHEERACNTILLNLSEFVTVSQALHVVAQARVLGIALMVGCDAMASEDAFPMDLAIGIGCGQIKMGGLLSAEAVARYNRLAAFLEDPKAPAYVGTTFRR
ncbi:enolase-like protein [Achlya hypogyna]|uniref:phosphopyruvate hydratase n=1 Tax=Achlya hypogyna TaxID=1202772 RepID=A0A1V9Z993_ACHHY|nr:enolase-like protein [Achlya hypogyna]